MPSFTDSFWSGDYAGGLGVLFGKLQQGAVENRQILTIARMRSDAEDLYGQKLGDITPATDRITGGFARDDGASVRKVGSWVVLRKKICADRVVCPRLMRAFGARWKKLRRTTRR